MFGKKMRNSLSTLAPQRVVDLKGEMNKNKIKKDLDNVKLRYDRKHNSKLINLKPGDSVRIKMNNGEFTQPKIVIHCEKTSVNTDDGKKWPLEKVSLRRRLKQNFTPAKTREVETIRRNLKF